MKSDPLSTARAIIRVGDGRGFVVRGKSGLYVLTAAHCLPRKRGNWLPPPATISHVHERTYKSLLGPIGKKPTVWAKCRFADPVGDIAILAAPDGQADLVEQQVAYEEMIRASGHLAVGGTGPLTYDEVGQANAPAKLLSLGGQWFECTLGFSHTGLLWIDKADQEIEPGMSGSPIMSHDLSKAIGILTTNGKTPTPRLTHQLPGWFLARMPPRTPGTVTKPAKAK